MPQVKTVRTDLLICSDESGMRECSQSELLELADDLKISGLRAALPVVQAGKYYDVKKGIKCWKAALLAGLSEVPVIIETADAEIALAQILENQSMANCSPAWNQKIAVIANILMQETSMVYPRLAELENLFSARGQLTPSVAEKEQLQDLRKQYSALKRRLNKERKARQTYLVEFRSGWCQQLAFAFKFEGQWYGYDKNPPVPLGNVTKAWLIPVNGVLDPNSI